LSAGLIGLDSRGQRGFVAQKTPSWNLPNFLVFDKFHVLSPTSGRESAKAQNTLRKKLLDSPEYHQRQIALKAHYSFTAEDNFGFPGRCKLDVQIFEDYN